MLTFVLVVVAAALLFEFINGFHDTANSIATVVATKVLSPAQAVILAAVTNLIGAVWGTAVAKTIASSTSARRSSCARCWAASSGTCSPGGAACRPRPRMP